MPHRDLSARPLPSYCDTTGDSESLLAFVERATLAAVADEIEQGRNAERANTALSDYVALLRSRQAPPEGMLICLKKLLQRSALTTLPEKDAQKHYSDFITRAIAAYYEADRAA